MPYVNHRSHPPRRSTAGILARVIIPSSERGGAGLLGLAVILSCRGNMWRVRRAANRSRRMVGGKLRGAPVLWRERGWDLVRCAARPAIESDHYHGGSVFEPHRDGAAAMLDFSRFSLSNMVETGTVLRL